MFLKILAIFSFLIGIGYSQNALVRAGKYPDKERIVLQLEKSVDYKVYTLESPKRVVVDVFEQISVELSSFPQARVGTHPWGTRVVFEKDFERIKAFSLHEPFRIVIDLYFKKELENQTARNEEDELIEIIDPVFIRIVRETGSSQKRVVNEVRSGQIITQKRVVVIDPGHGGYDPGAVGFMGIEEKNIVLSIGKRLAKLLQEDGRFRVIMTRTKDEFIPLHERANIAIRNRADLFISLHADAHPQKLPDARGTTIFAISSEAAQKRRQHIVNSENYAKLVFGKSDIPVPARAVLADLAMDVTLNESLVFGKSLAKSIRRELGRDVHFRGIQRAGFAVLKTPGIPSLLVEVGFMTNPQEVIMMSDEGFQEEFARAIYRAIVDYFFPGTKKVTSGGKTYAAVGEP